MKNVSSSFAVTFFLFSLFIPLNSAQASEASVKITKPADNAVLKSSDPVVLEYEITPGPKGDHAHLMVDGKMSGLLKSMKGTHDIGKLAPGKHTITLVVMSSSHSPIGVNGVVTVDVQ